MADRRAAYRPCADDGSFDVIEDWKDLDRSVQPVDSFRGGTGEGLKLLDEFVKHKLATLSREPRQARDRWHQPPFALSALRTHRPAYGHARRAELEERRKPPKTTTLTSSSPGVSCPSTSSTSIRCTTRSSAHPTGRTRLWPRMPAIPGPFSTLASSSSPPKLTTSYGTPRNFRCCTPDGCTTTCACTGRRKFWSGVPRPPLPSRPRSTSTTSIFSMAAILTATRSRVGHRRQVRPSVVRAPHLRHDSLDVRRCRTEKVRR